MYFTTNNTRRYINVHDERVSRYHNTKHSSIKITPVKGSIPGNKHAVYINLYGTIVHDTSPKPQSKCHGVNKVHITRNQEKFCKGYSPNCTEELFEVWATIQ
jgi:hypothetical protein